MANSPDPVTPEPVTAWERAIYGGLGLIAVLLLLTALAIEFHSC